MSRANSATQSARTEIKGLPVTSYPVGYVIAYVRRFAELVERLAKRSIAVR
jgi:hypothetical protein